MASNKSEPAWIRGKSFKVQHHKWKEQKWYASNNQLTLQGSWLKKQRVTEESNQVTQDKV